MEVELFYLKKKIQYTTHAPLWDWTYVIPIPNFFLNQGVWGGCDFDEMPFAPRIIGMK